MNENELQDALKTMLEQLGGDGNIASGESPEDDRDFLEEMADAMSDVKRVRTFDEEGVMTNNAGLVITTADGEFQLTIVRSR